MNYKIFFIAMICIAIMSVSAIAAADVDNTATDLNNTVCPVNDTVISENALPSVVYINSTDYVTFNYVGNTTIDVDYYKNVTSFEDFQTLEISRNEIWTRCNLTRPTDINCYYKLHLNLQKDVQIKDMLSTGIFQTVTIQGNNYWTICGKDEEESHFITNHGILILRDLKICNFRTAIFNNGILGSEHNRYYDNYARYCNNLGLGGAIRNNGQLFSVNDSFINNWADYGGAIFNENGYISLTNCDFVRNYALRSENGDNIGNNSDLPKPYGKIINTILNETNNSTIDYNHLRVGTIIKLEIPVRSDIAGILLNHIYSYWRMDDCSGVRLLKNTTTHIGFCKGDIQEMVFEITNENYKINLNSKYWISVFFVLIPLYENIDYNFNVDPLHWSFENETYPVTVTINPDQW